MSIQISGTEGYSGILNQCTFINSYTEETNVADTGATYAINLANGTIQILTLTNNCTYTFPDVAAGKSFTIIQKQDATGGRTVTWPSSVKWPYGGNAPSITSTASKADIFNFVSDGVYWFGLVASVKYL